MEKGRGSLQGPKSKESEGKIGNLDGQMAVGGRGVEGQEG